MRKGIPLSVICEFRSAEDRELVMITVNNRLVVDIRNPILRNIFQDADGSAHYW